jgi:hypothetical protein
MTALRLLVPVVSPLAGALSAQPFIDQLGELTGGTRVMHHHSGALRSVREVGRQV